MNTVVRISLLAVLAFSGLFRAPDAAAQESIECKSHKYQYKECHIPWARAQLQRQTSNAGCIENQTWGQGRGFVWVHQGCAAIFTEARWTGDRLGLPGREELTCRSDRYRYSECRTNWRSAQLVQQISEARCIEGQTWGFRRGVLWVDKGCAGLFSSGVAHPGADPGQHVQCDSQKNRYRECRVGNWRGAQLVNQTSNAPCIEGRTWGYGQGILWVNQGCAGTFAPTWGHWSPGGGLRRISCNSENNRPRQCPTGGWSGAQLVRQTSRASCVEGRTWGFRNGAIWVDQGCAGEFIEERRWR